MDGIIKVRAAKKDLYLLYNGAALFELQETHGDPQALIDALNDRSKKGFEALCHIVAVLAEQGELMRRYIGHTPTEIPKESDLAVAITPLDILALVPAASSAIIKGLSREETEGEEIDLGLAELQKKTE